MAKDLGRIEDEVICPWCSDVQEYIHDGRPFSCKRCGFFVSTENRPDTIEKKGKDDE